MRSGRGARKKELMAKKRLFACQFVSTGKESVYNFMIQIDSYGP